MEGRHTFILLRSASDAIPLAGLGSEWGGFSALVAPDEKKEQKLLALSAGWDIIR
jgi:hypothetical protein